MPVNDFAIPRGATEPVTSKQTAEKVWEPKFLAEIVAGRDPHLSPSRPKREGVLTVADFLDQYFTNDVEAEGLKTADTIRGHIKQLEEGLGELPVTAVEKPADIVRFKAQYRKGRTLATVNRIKRRDENKRDRRIHREEEQQLLAACVTMNTAEHKWVGPAMHDRIIGAIETCCRQGEMLRIRNKEVDWAQHQIVIRGATAKDSENRRIPFDPQGRPAPILKRRGTLGPQRFVFGSPDGEFVASFKTAWESLLLWPMDTRRSARSQGRESTARSFATSTSTGTTCDTKAPVGCSPTASTSESFN